MIRSILGSRRALAGSDSSSTEEQHQKEQRRMRMAGQPSTNGQVNVTLYSHQGGPNGWKVAVVLNELGLTYRTIFTDFQKGDHRKEEFLRVCPNGRIPAIIDHLNNDLPVWESGSILWYLVTRYDPEAKLWSRDLNTQTQIMSWLMLQVSGHGVIQGQAFWFKFFHPEHVESAVQRYVDECRRVYGVLEVQLAEKREQLMDSFGEEGEDGDGDTREEIGGDEGLEEKRLSEMPIWLVGNHVTICDLSYLTWSRTAHRIGIDLETEFPEVSRWINAMMARPKVAEALKPPLE